MQCVSRLLSLFVLLLALLCVPLKGLCEIEKNEHFFAEHYFVCTIVSMVNSKNGIFISSVVFSYYKTTSSAERNGIFGMVFLGGDSYTHFMLLILYL